MGAKNDLNEIYVKGSLILAIMIGISAQSLGAFVVAAVVLLGISVATSKIR